MSLKYVLLGLLRQQPRYGYVLKRDAERLLGPGAELNPGQLYPLLRKLAEQQLIVGERVEQEDRPDKRVFTLTEAGERDLQGWLDEPVVLPIGRSPLFLRYLVLSLVRPMERAAFLVQQRRRLLDDIGRLVNDRAEDADGGDAGASPGAALRELAIMHAEADLRWIEWLESK